MATPSTQRYPLSTQNGDWIPLDVARPSGLIKAAFTSGAATSPAALPASSELLVVRATKDCFIKFANSSATKPTTSVVVDTLYLRRGEVQVVSPLNLFYSVIGDTENGDLYIQIMEVWQSISLQQQQSRI